MVGIPDGFDLGALYSAFGDLGAGLAVLILMFFGFGLVLKLMKRA